MPAELQEGFKLIRQHTTTPIATGEVSPRSGTAQELIREQWIDYIRMALFTRAASRICGGLRDFADLYHVRTVVTVRPTFRR